jgi:hypothetical protein
MPPARDRAALVDCVSNPLSPPRARTHAAEELLRKFPAVTRSLKELLGLFPRPVTPDTFDAAADAFDRVRSRREFSVITTKQEAKKP